MRAGIASVDDAPQILTGNEIHYACDPKENGDHFFIGFLTRSTNPQVVDLDLSLLFFISLSSVNI
jgi:hypothetical protein